MAASQQQQHARRWESRRGRGLPAVAVALLASGIFAAFAPLLHGGARLLGGPRAFMAAAGGRRGSANVRSNVQPRELPPPQVDAASSEPWRMMPLGVPKVAYRVPGAPNADWVDIYNRLYRERIIFLGKEIDDRLANEIIGVLLYLDSEDNNKPIYIYINSGGGSVIAGLAIYDTMQHIKSPVITINVGLAASMASFLLASGEKGKRLALPNSRTMIHQAMGGAQGQAEDIKIEATQILQIHENLVRMYARVTGKSTEVIAEDLQRDNFMSAEEAKEYGIIDQVIKLQDLELTQRAPPGEKKEEAPASEKKEEEAAAAPAETPGAAPVGEKTAAAAAPAAPADEGEEPKTDSRM